MAPAQSRSGRTITPSAKKSKFDSVGAYLDKSNSKQPKKAARKQKHARRVATPSPSPESDQELIEEVTRQSSKPRKAPIDVTECKYTVGCVTIFNDRKFNQDSGSFHLGGFKAHEYDAKAIKAVQVLADKAKLGYELESTLAIVLAPRLKQLTKTIRDPSDWEGLESLIEDYMKDGFRFLRVDYTVTYSKAPRRVNGLGTDDYDDGDDEDAPARKRARGNVYSV